MKRILGYVLSIIGVISFISLYFLMILFKDTSFIGYVIMGVGYVSVSLFIIGVILIVKTKKQV